MFARIVESVERVEEFLLDALLAGEELDVVDQEDIRLAVSSAEAHELAVLDRVDEFVGEFLGREIRHARSLFVAPHVLADGVEQVRFAQTDPTIKEKRVVGFAGRLRDREGRGVGEGVVVAHDKSVESVLGIEGMLARSRVPVGGSEVFLGPRLAGFDQGRALGVGDVELDLQGLTDRLDQRIVDQAQIIIRQPHFTKLVGYFQSENFSGERAGLQRRKPEVVKIRVERAAQNLLRGNPNLLGRCLHVRWFQEFPFGRNYSPVHNSRS